MCTHAVAPLVQKYIAIQAEHFDAFVAVEGGGLSEEALYTQLKQEQLLTANATTMAARYLKWASQCNAMLFDAPDLGSSAGVQVLSGLEYPAFLEMMVDYSAQFHDDDDDDDDDDEMDAEDEHERDLKDASVLVESLSI
jgi:hypothetical protein